ncbi:MAG: thioredoxin family protein [Pirellulales bacterium]|nr:thioredoxin family protein [Pirellulales bacterium]
MTSLTLATILQASILAATAGGTADSPTVDDYASARAKTEKTGKPIVILVGADWCPACVQMKKDVMPKIRKQGVLEQVAYATVNLDKEGKLGKELTGGGPIPQMIMYRKTHKGWLRRCLIGGQSPKTVKSFILRGVELDTAAKKAESKKSNSKKGKAKSKPVTESKQVRNDMVPSKKAV